MSNTVGRGRHSRADLGGKAQLLKLTLDDKPVADYRDGQQGGAHGGGATAATCLESAGQASGGRGVGALSADMARRVLWMTVKSHIAAPGPWLAHRNRASCAAAAILQSPLAHALIKSRSCRSQSGLASAAETGQFPP